MKLTSTLQGMTATARLGRCPSADDPGLSTGNSVQKSSLKIVSYIVSSESGLSLAPSGPYQELLLILRRLAEHFAAAACTLASNKGSPCILGTHTKCLWFCCRLEKNIVECLMNDLAALVSGGHEILLFDLVRARRFARIRCDQNHRIWCNSCHCWPGCPNPCRSLRIRPTFGCCGLVGSLLRNCTWQRFLFLSLCRPCCNISR